jgi:hypothetical protein
MGSITHRGGRERKLVMVRRYDVSPLRQGDLIAVGRRAKVFSNALTVRGCELTSPASGWAQYWSQARV